LGVEILVERGISVGVGKGRERKRGRETYEIGDVIAERKEVGFTVTF
jgi:hypothetical protein